MWMQPAELLLKLLHGTSSGQADSACLDAAWHGSQRIAQAGGGRARGRALLHVCRNACPCCAASGFCLAIALIDLSLPHIHTQTQPPSSANCLPVRVSAGAGQLALASSGSRRTCGTHFPHIPSPVYIALIPQPPPHPHIHTPSGAHARLHPGSATGRQAPGSC